MGTLEIGFLVAAVVVVGVVLVRSLTGRGVETIETPRSEAPIASSEADADDDDDDQDGDDLVAELGGEIAAITSDGVTFVPRSHAIALVVTGRPDPDAPGSWVPRREDEKHTVETLGQGELIAARVRRGAPDHDPWRIEALGRDHEYRAWRFETEDAAHAALVLLDAKVVRAPRDEHGDPVMVGEAEFAEARRIEEETERELAAAGDEEFGEPEPPR